MAPLSALWLVLGLHLAHVALAESFNPLHHSGAASPYFDAPSLEGLSSNTPAGCVVDQAAYIVRHGSRYPEPGTFAGWQSLFTKLQNTSYTARGSLAFIGSWVPPVDDSSHEPLFLSSTGAGEAFALGVDLRKRYRLIPGGAGLTVWSAGQQRVVDTASYFLSGYLSQGSYLSAPLSNRGTIVALPDSVNYTSANSLTPSAACPRYSSGDTSASANMFRAAFRPAIVARLNALLDGLALDADDVGVMQDLCGFQAEVSGDTRFCAVFEEREWLDYEYAHDLNYYYGSGPGNPFSATTGFPWVKAVTDLFVKGPNSGNTTAVPVPNSTFSPPPLLMSFTHDNDLPPVLSALGLWNASSSAPLSLTTPDPAREFRSSHVVAFRGYVALERLSCAAPLDAQKGVRHTAGQIVVAPGRGADASKFVRVRVDNAPVSIPGCKSGPGSSCPLADFVRYIDGPREKASGDFVQVCGLQDVANATGVFDAFVKIPADAQVLQVPMAV